MRLLLDTHTFIWFIMGSDRLSPKARALIEAPQNHRLVSVASLWEMAIKMSIGKLTMTAPFDALIPVQLRQNGISLLSIETEHVATVAGLPFHHRDPFDRLLIAQCMVENLPIVSADEAFDAYPTHRLW